MAKSVKQKEKEYKEKHNMVSVEMSPFKTEMRAIDKVYEAIKDKYDCGIDNNVLMFKGLESREQYNFILNDIESRFGHIVFSTGFTLKAI